VPMVLVHFNIVDHMREWTFLTRHTGVLVCIARNPGVRLRDIAAVVGVSERTVVSIVNDLTEAGYVVKDKDGRRTRYSVQRDVPLRESIGHERTIGELLAILTQTQAGS
jgi:Mn-dependent DtxR family transcriptional regulator